MVLAYAQGIAAANEQTLEQVLNSAPVSNYARRLGVDIDRLK